MEIFDLVVYDDLYISMYENIHTTMVMYVKNTLRDVILLRIVDKGLLKIPLKNLRIGLHQIVHLAMVITIDKQLEIIHRRKLIYMTRQYRIVNAIPNDIKNSNNLP